MDFNPFDIGYVMRLYYFPEEGSKEIVDKILEDYTRVYLNSEKRSGECSDVHLLDYVFFYGRIHVDAYQNSKKFPTSKKLSDFYDFYENLKVEEIVGNLEKKKVTSI